MTKQILFTTQFKKDYKMAIKCGLPIKELDAVISLLAQDVPLPEKYKDHNLSGTWIGFKECHILPNWLLIYSPRFFKFF